MRRTKIGVVVSVLWIGVAAYFAFRDTSVLPTMGPNEWGDFFAGFSAPLAFLWLVLGYFQQGDELRLSTKALLLQADELKHSVEQQRQLVEVTREQIQGEREALKHERSLREDLSLPRFSVNTSSASYSADGRTSYQITVANAGHDATAFTTELMLLGGPWKEQVSLRPLFGKGDSFNTMITHPSPLPDGESQLRLRYTDGLGRRQETIFKVRRVSDAPDAKLEFIPAPAAPEI